jgi:hypothetical protein
MTKEMHRGSAGAVMDASGWHVHYKAKTDDRVRVRLALNREAAIDIARELLREKSEVVRLVMHDGSETIDGDQIGILCGSKAISR